MMRTPKTPVDPIVSKRMAATRGDNPKEKALRSALHRLGLRFRIHRRILPRRRRSIDIVFPGPRVAVFFDGCFWHGCPMHGTWPKKNAEWWRDKIETNKRRDRDTDEQLTKLGWMVLRVWEHEAIEEASHRIDQVVRGRTTTRASQLHGAFRGRLLPPDR